MTPAIRSGAALAGAVLLLVALGVAFALRGQAPPRPTPQPVATFQLNDGSLGDTAP